MAAGFVFFRKEFPPTIAAALIKVYVLFFLEIKP
jgi:hypothetical protein